MIEKYLKVLESFKIYQISVRLKTIYDVLLTALNSAKFSSKVAPKLKGIKGFALVENQVTHIGVPFAKSEYELDPAHISQIKIILNVMYHAHKALTDLENLDVRKLNTGLASIPVIYYNTINEAYEACKLLTHPDVDLRSILVDEYLSVFRLLGDIREILGDELHLIMRLVEWFKANPNNIEPLPPLPPSEQSSTVWFRAGSATGIAVDQMHPKNGEADYNYLAQFSSDLPGHISALTQYISQFSSSFIQSESQLNQAKLLEVQNAAFKLLTDLDDLNARSVFMPLKFLNYIHIIRHVITLSLSTLAEIKNLSGSTQDVIRDKIGLLKYQLLPVLFGFVDKIEAQLMLRPGFLSAPFMRAIKPVYATLIHYAKGPVDFYAKGEELLSIEDSGFLSLRLEHSYRRIDEANKNLFKIRKAQKACEAFFTTLENKVFAELTLRELPDEIKRELKTLYKQIKPYVIDAPDIGMGLNNAIIDGLNAPSTWFYEAGKKLLWLKRDTPGDKVSRVLGVKAAVNRLIAKNKTTQEFQIELNNDLIIDVQEKADLALFPYKGDNVFVIDESQALAEPDEGMPAPRFQDEPDGNRILAEDDANVALLSCDQALDLYQWYQNKHNKFDHILLAYTKLIEQLTLIENAMRMGLPVDPNAMQRCRAYYNTYQPYFVSSIPPARKAEAVAFDKYLSHFLAGKKPDTKRPKNLFADEKLSAYLQEHLTAQDRLWINRSKYYLHLAEQKYALEHTNISLVKDDNNTLRAQHVVHHTDFSKFARGLRTYLFTLTEHLNESMQAQLKPKPDLPFPELEKTNETLAQSKQVLGLKSIYNALYHLEGIILQLEELKNDDYQWQYVLHLYFAYGHITQILELKKSLSQDSYLGFLLRELMEFVQDNLSTIKAKSGPYLLDPLKVGDQTPLKYSGLWYAMNAFYIGPKQIRSIKNNNYITSEVLDSLQCQAKVASATIENSIKNSSSYFKLFLQSPEMYTLYQGLNDKFADFTITSHFAVVNHLHAIQKHIITPMLVLADHWEDQAGLHPGSLSRKMKEITDEYLKGLLLALGLSSKAHIAIITDDYPLKHRQQVIAAHSAEIRSNIANITKEYQFFATFHELIVNYQEMMDDSYHVSDLEITKTKAALIKTYKEALYKFSHFKAKIPVRPSEQQKDIDLDTLLNNSTHEYNTKYTNINALALAACNYYRGLRATQELKLSTFVGKQAYLTALEITQQENNRVFREKYPELSFNKYLDVYCDLPILLQYAHTDFRKELKDFLLTFKLEVMATAKDADDINVIVNQLLKKKHDEFKQTHFDRFLHLDKVKTAFYKYMDIHCNLPTTLQHTQTEYYKALKDFLLPLEAEITQAAKNTPDFDATVNQLLQQKYDQFKQNHFNQFLCLDKVRTALAGFDEYLSNAKLTVQNQTSTFESRATLEKKMVLINRLHAIAGKTSLSVDARMVSLTLQVNDARFPATMLKSTHVHDASVASLKSGITALQEALTRYTAINPVPTPSSTVATNPHGMFAPAVGMPSSPATATAAATFS